MADREFDKIARYYDAYIQWDKRLSFEMPFLLSILERSKARTVLDAGCGSGRHSMALAKAGYDVVGIDPSPFLIRIADDFASREKDRPFFIMAELQDLRREPGGLLGPHGPLHNSQFDACLLLGNTVSMLGNDDDIAWYFELIRKASSEAGSLVIQMPNYANRVRRRDPSTRFRNCILNGEPCMLIKTFTYAEKSSGNPTVILHMLRICRRGHSFELEDNALPIQALAIDQLQKLLWSAGFLEMRFYGSMDGSDFDIDTSPECIAVAKLPVH
jgi:SAM-dependent methyltransferase